MGGPEQMMNTTFKEKHPPSTSVNEKLHKELEKPGQP